MTDRDVLTAGKRRLRRLPAAAREWFARRLATRGGRVRLALFVLVLVLLSPAAVSAVTYEPVALEQGSIESPANGTTVIAVQGFKLSGQDSGKKPARLIGVGPRGKMLWEHGTDGAINWFYDVDPLDDGTLLVVGANRSGTIVAKYDPQRDRHVWVEHLDAHDTHDVDLINGDQLLVANMRNYNASAERNDDRLYIYDRSNETVVWEFYFRNHYNRSAGGDYTDDWTHVNDVDKIGPGRYLASPRNMDQVIVVNRSRKEITMQLGADENHSVLYEQHNPQYLTGAGGTPTILVADSENDRIVEYARTDDGWKRTWTLGSSESLNWPRDADRLPNGNTLVVDSLNHRVMEVTPTGEVVWEYYAPWGTYDAERVRLGDEPGGPTIRQQGATGTYQLWGSATLVPGTGGATFAHWLSDTFAGTPVSREVDWLAARWSHVVPWIRPVWMRPWDFVAVLGAGLVLVGWTGGEIVHRRRAIRRGAAGAVGRLLGRERDGDAGGGTDASADARADADTNTRADVDADAAGGED